MPRLAALVVAGILCCGLFGCAQTAFNPSFSDNVVGDLRATLKKIKKAPLAPSNSIEKALAFIVTTKPTHLIAYDLAAGSSLWKIKGEITSRVIVGNKMIYHRAGRRELVGRGIIDGKVHWTTELGEEGERLLGMATDGDNLYYTTEAISRKSSASAGRLVAVDGRSGKSRWVRSSNGRLGAPAVRDGWVFVPLRTQSIAVIDAATGNEKARVRSQQEALLWVRSGIGGVLFGGKSGIYRYDEKAASGEQKSSSFLSADLPESVRPVYWWDGYNAALSGYTAYDRNRLLWNDDGDTLAFHRGLIFVHNYRFLFAFGEKGDKGVRQLKWAYSNPQDAVASTYTGEALLLLTKNGHLLAIDPEKGLPVMSRKVLADASVRGATFDAGGFKVPGEASGATDLRKTLKEVIWDPDRRFGAVKLFAVEELGKLTGPEVSSDLVEIVTRAEIDRAVYKRAGEIIVSRHDKSAIPLYLRTLRSHYSFVEKTRSMAVDVMADALGDLKAPEAVEPLLGHLADHETPLEGLASIVKALIAIDNKAVVEPFRDLLLTYRCDPLFGKKKAQGVLNLIAEALLRMGGEEERQMLGFIANDVHTLPSLRTYIDKMLRQTSDSSRAPKRKSKRKESK